MHTRSQPLPPDGLQSLETPRRKRTATATVSSNVPSNAEQGPSNTRRRATHQRVASQKASQPAEGSYRTECSNHYCRGSYPTGPGDSPRFSCAFPSSRDYFRGVHRCDHSRCSLYRHPILVLTNRLAPWQAGEERLLKPGHDRFLVFAALGSFPALLPH
jgi:hypothetical protein